jgi:hypothetical protein
VALEGLFISLSVAGGWRLSAVSTIDGFGGRGTWKSASGTVDRFAALAMTVEAFVVLRSVRHHIEFESKRRSASGSRPGHKRAQG